MIKKKNNSYRLIKENIAKLTLIQKATGISALNLTAIFLRNSSDKDLRLMKKTKDGYWQWDLSDKTPYKYFKRESVEYLRKTDSTKGFKVILEVIENSYLTKSYFGYKYDELLLSYLSQEKVLKNFVREAFIAVFPITPEMSPKEKAVRNQRLGKISASHWIGDIVHCDYFSRAPGFMMDNVKNSINIIELYVANLLNDKDLDHDLDKVRTNQNLQAKLQSKPQEVKKKIFKI
jgi:hypothetical protein